MAEAKFVNREKILARFMKMPAAVKEAAGGELKTQVNGLADALRRAAPASAFELKPGAEHLAEHIEVYENESRVLSFRVIAAARDSKGRYFGRYVEFGHTAEDGSFVPAQPFFFPTYRAWKPTAIRRIRAAVRKRLKAEFPES
jgi:hypothetical protein